MGRVRRISIGRTPKTGRARSGMGIGRNRPKADITILIMCVVPDGEFCQYRAAGRLQERPNWTIDPLRMQQGEPNMRLVQTTAFILSVVATNANASDLLCGDMSGIDRGECLTKLLYAEEAKLNQAYESAHKVIDTQDSIPISGREEWKHDLDKARDSWENYRDAECALVLYQWWGGSGAGNAVTACRAQMTIERTRAISTFGKAR